MLPRDYSGPCLVGAALTPEGARADLAPHSQWQISGHVRQWAHRYASSHDCKLDCSVELRFDNLCERFGVERTAALIRARILGNRLWRELSQSRALAPTHPENHT